MRPGQTASPSWHKAGSDLLVRGEEARRTLLLLWTVLGILTGGAALQAGADLVSSTVNADGSVMSRTIWTTDDSIITGTVFGTGPSGLTRETGTGTAAYSSLSSWSDGPLLLGSYASLHRQEKDRPLACVFENTTRQDREMVTESSGILRHGNYSQLITRESGGQFITVDGQGLVDLRHRLVGNGTVSGRTVASGNVSVSEQIRTGQGDSPLTGSPKLH